MEKNEVSIQEVQVYIALKKVGWITNKELSTVSKVPLRTVAFKTKKFVDLGLCDIAEVYPGHRYRLSSKAGKRNQAYSRRLDQAVEIFGL